MPLKCLSGSTEIFAFDYEGREQWEALRDLNARDRGLQMACCGAGVTLRTSKLGTRHFAHARRGECATAPESAEHLLAKLHICRAISAAGWQAHPEQSGTTPDGQAWRADVLAVKGSARVAFEVQMSPQTNEETLLRQLRYKQAGVRGLWLMHQAAFDCTREVPAFNLVLDRDSSTFSVRIPDPSHFARVLKSRNKDEGQWLQTVDLSTFVQGALHRRLVYAPALQGKPLFPVEVLASSTGCWKCNRVTAVVVGFNFLVGQIIPKARDLFFRFSELASVKEQGPETVLELLGPVDLRQYDIGAIKQRFSKTRNCFYLSNGCVHCGALQGEFFEFELLESAELAFTTQGCIDERWLKHVWTPGGSPLHWWFGEQSPQAGSQPGQ